MPYDNDGRFIDGRTREGKRLDPVRERESINRYAFQIVWTYQLYGPDADGFVDYSGYDALPAEDLRLLVETTDWVEEREGRIRITPAGRRAAESGEALIRYVEPLKPTLLKEALAHKARRAKLAERRKARKAAEAVKADEVLAKRTNLLAQIESLSVALAQVEKERDAWFEQAKIYGARIRSLAEVKKERAE